MLNKREQEPSIRKKNKNNKNQRRFSDDQIRSLESIFETETRLEARKKLQFAKELGLQPRQVAIWFQNKRARWKSKQLEQDYSALQANYDSLLSKFENLKREKLALATQLQKLNEQIQKQRENVECRFQGSSSKDIKQVVEPDNSAETNKIVNEPEQKQRMFIERAEQGVLGVVSDEDSGIKAEYFGLDEENEEPKLISKAPDGSLTSQEDWGSLDSDGLFDQSSSDYQWWDVWT